MSLAIAAMLMYDYPLKTDMETSFYSSLVKTPEPYSVIFSHPAHLYHHNHMPALTQPHPASPSHTQMEPVDLSLSKRSSSSTTSSSSSPRCSSASSPASSRSTPPSPYSSSGRVSPRRSPQLTQRHSSPSHALPPPGASLSYPAMVAPLMGSGSGVIQSSGVMVSPVMVPLSVLYPSPLHLHQPIMVSPPLTSNDDPHHHHHHRSRDHKTVQSTKSLEGRGDAHDVLKRIKTEPQPELIHEHHSTHDIKSSVIRIQHEYEARHLASASPASSSLLSLICSYSSVFLPTFIGQVQSGSCWHSCEVIVSVPSLALGVTRAVITSQQSFEHGLHCLYCT
ncbi:Krueppel-like factor 3 isoform X4 [Corythoichthys intestinalis]|uniref:Krueppel-like factor 3 isoform X4 n=1 Tax=Corythoichthys intestinalis TaxID=161448 RepID=UPI0025A5A99E|nr:Krueppel-like factor 3 isoform X4 [Corythoichthys intestinalis]